MTQKGLKREEQVAFALRSTYRKYGYLPYKMNKFERYDLYAENKDFLVGNGVITFNDTDGKLLALKPDVTLSIVQNMGNDKDRKVYYHENVYRIAGDTKQFKEFMQVGLEHIGDIGTYDIFEAVYLAGKSLAEISNSFVLDISHVGILACALDNLCKEESFQTQMLGLIGSKNIHDAKTLCQQKGLPCEEVDEFLALIKVYGNVEDVLKQIAPFCKTAQMKKAYNQFKAVCDLLLTTELKDHIRIDFSVVDDSKYYNGIVIKGFIDGVGIRVLSGGQYDKLMEKMGKNTGAIGFAVYLDHLEGFFKVERELDVDVLILYDESVSAKTLKDTVDTQIHAGKSVTAQKSVGKLRYATLIDLTSSGVKI